MKYAKFENVSIVTRNSKVMPAKYLVPWMQRQCPMLGG